MSLAHTLFYVLMAVSMCGSLFVMGILWKYASISTAATQLVFLIHLTLLCKEVVAIPHVYTTANDMCEAVAFFHLYSGLANAITVSLLVLSHRVYIVENHPWKEFFDRADWKLLAIFGLPLITLLPFLTDSYKNDHSVWCVMDTDTHSTDLWAFLVYYLWIWAILLPSAIVLLVIWYQVHAADPNTAAYFFSTVGIYCIVAILGWVPRTFARFSEFGTVRLNSVSFFYSFVIVSTTGIVYTLVFLKEAKNLIAHARNKAQLGENGSDHSSNSNSAFLARSGSTTPGVRSPSNPGSPLSFEEDSAFRRVESLYGEENPIVMGAWGDSSA